MHVAGVGNSDFHPTVANNDFNTGDLNKNTPGEVLLRLHNCTFHPPNLAVGLGGRKEGEKTDMGHESSSLH